MITDCDPQPCSGQFLCLVIDLHVIGLLSVEVSCQYIAFILVPFVSKFIFIRLLVHKRKRGTIIFVCVRASIRASISRVNNVTFKQNSETNQLA
jgi:hypothetical protein